MKTVFSHKNKNYIIFYSGFYENPEHVQVCFPVTLLLWLFLFQSVKLGKRLDAEKMITFNFFKHCLLESSFNFQNYVIFTHFDGSFKRIDTSFV